MRLEHSDQHLVGLNLSEGSYGVRVGPEVSEVKFCELDESDPSRIVRSFALGIESRTRDGGIVLSGEVEIRKGRNCGIQVNGSKIVLADPYAEVVKYFPTGEKQLDIVSVAAEKTPFDFSGPRIKIDDLRIYEAHMKGLTALHPRLRDDLRGKMAGAAKIGPEHVVDMGMTAIEFLPLAAFNPFNSYAVKRGLTDYWGYNPDAFTAVHPFYSAKSDPREEFGDMVDAFHRKGLAFILDLVYNHMGVDSRRGIGAALKALNKNAFHQKDSPDDGGFSGVGESPNLGDPMVLNLVLDSIRTWISRGVDRIRFDLATTLMRDSRGYVTMENPFAEALKNDPVLKNHVMIAEPWDLGPYGYQVGNFSRHGFMEWDDRPQQQIYDYWRGMGNVSDSEYNAKGRGNPQKKVFYLAPHDGFTVRQSVSYWKKDNEKSKQNNENGNNGHFWNSGHEGLKNTPIEVEKLRLRRMKSMYLDLILTNASIMIRADDMRANDANNDRWSLDEPNSWNDWSGTDTYANLTVEFVAAAMKWREQSGYFGLAANTNKDKQGRPLGNRIDTSYIYGEKIIGQGLSDSLNKRDQYIAFKNGTHDDLIGDRALNLPDDGEYCVIFNTAEETMPDQPLVVRGRLEIPALTLVLLKKKK